jgi:DNA-binding NarL/FixJ family response regulator
MAVPEGFEPLTRRLEVRGIDVIFVGVLHRTLYSVGETCWSNFLCMNSSKHKHVLMADDSVTVRHILKRYLSTRGDMVVCGEAVNGREAVEKAMTLKPDLVPLDLMMPELNGAEVASVLKGAIPKTHIILFTMYSENIGKYLTSAVGIDSVLSKPDGVTELAAAIDSALNQSSDSTN